MKIRIICDGFLTKIVNVETGEALDDVTEVEWSHAAGGNLPTVRLTLVDVSVDLIGETDEDDLNVENSH